MQFADSFGYRLRSTDAVAHLPWSDASAAVAEWLDEPGSWVVEGVRAAHALRKWRAHHPGESPPVDFVFVLREPYVALSKGQAAMGAGIETVLEEVGDWLGERLIYL
jgi:hypothetical protein